MILINGDYYLAQIIVSYIFKLWLNCLGFVVLTARTYELRLVVWSINKIHELPVSMKATFSILRENLTEIRQCMCIFNTLGAIGCGQHIRKRRVKRAALKLDSLFIERKIRILFVWWLIVGQCVFFFFFLSADSCSMVCAKALPHHFQFLRESMFKNERNTRWANIIYSSWFEFLLRHVRIKNSRLEKGKEKKRNHFK